MKRWHLWFSASILTTLLWAEQTPAAPQDRSPIGSTQSSEGTVARLRAAATADLNAANLRRLAERVAMDGASSSDPAQRALAARALGHVESGQDLLLRLSQDSEPSVRKAALSALSRHRLEPASLPVLRRALDGATLPEAAVLLARLGDRQGVARLLESLRHGQNPGECAAALLAIGELDRAGAVVRDLLARADTVAAGALAAAPLLSADLIAPLIAAYRPSPAPVRQQILAVLSTLGRAAGQPVRALAHRAVLDPDADVRIAGIRALLAFHHYNKALSYRLIDALMDKSPAVRASAAAGLALAGGPATLGELYRAGRDRDQTVRRTLCEALLQQPIKGTATLMTMLINSASCPGPKAVPPQRRGAGERLLTVDEPDQRLEAAAEWLERRNADLALIADHRG